MEVCSCWTQGPQVDDQLVSLVLLGMGSTVLTGSSFIYVGVLGPVYSIALFLPTIIKEMGYTVVNAQRMS
jgi:hypothetical protein